jgi:dTDP-4-amino-4,6-dideoxygalactose transaminase
MEVPFGDLKRHYRAIQEEIDAIAHKALESGWYILGKEVSAFEAEFAAFCGVGYAVGVASGTDALQLALAALEVGPGDEVITVPNAGVPGTVAILQTGAQPVFVDVEEGSHNMDPELLEMAITPQTKVVMPVHLYGRPANMASILQICHRNEVVVVEDCAQAHGAHYHSWRVGAFGDMGCFSFYPTKNLGCFGDGGMVVTDDSDLAGRLRKLRQYGWGRKYYCELPGGTNSRLDELQAAVLRVKLPHLEKWNLLRQERARWYDELLASSSVMTPGPPPVEVEHVYHLYVVRNRHREALREHLRGVGIGTDVHYPLPTHLQPIYRHLGYKEGDFRISEQLAREVLSLPLYPELTRQEVEAVAAAVHAFVPPGGE